MRVPSLRRVPRYFALLVLCAASVEAGTESRVEPLGTRIDRVVSPYVTAADFRGVVAFQRDGEEPRIFPYGLASIELATPHREDGIFMIGSVSKQFTAAAILLLEQEGRLRTADPIARFLPDFPRGTEITIHQLLDHTAGVADVYSLPGFGRTAGLSGDFDRVIADLERQGLTHEPGSAWAYSNGGYSLLAAIVERASMLPYGEYLRRRIFVPLEMRDTADDAPGPAAPGRVPGYDPWGASALTPARPVAAAYLRGSGSLWSSARDLLTWSAALHGGKVLSADSYAKMTRDYGNGYGYGVSRFRRFERDVIGHDGRVSGYATDLARYVEDGLTVAVLSNVQSVARDEIRRLVAAAVLGEEIEPPASRSLRERAETPLTELVGEYSFGPFLTVSITETGGRLLARANEGGRSELVPTANGLWFSRMLYATVRFERDASGRVDRLLWGAGEGAPVGRRVR